MDVLEDRSRRSYEHQSNAERLAATDRARRPRAELYSGLRGFPTLSESSPVPASSNTFFFRRPFLTILPVSLLEFSVFAPVSGLPLGRTIAVPFELPSQEGFVRHNSHYSKYILDDQALLPVQIMECTTGLSVH